MASVPQAFSSRSGLLLVLLVTVLVCVQAVGTPAQCDAVFAFPITAAEAEFIDEDVAAKVRREKGVKPRVNCTAIATLSHVCVGVCVAGGGRCMISIY